MRHARTPNFQLSGPTVHFLYCVVIGAIKSTGLWVSMLMSIIVFNGNYGVDRGDGYTFCDNDGSGDNAVAGNCGYDDGIGNDG